MFTGAARHLAVGGPRQGSSKELFHVHTASVSDPARTPLESNGGPRGGYRTAVFRRVSVRWVRLHDPTRHFTAIPGNGKGSALGPWPACIRETLEYS
eukprot:6155646-Prymnesium_polylepis.1